MLNASWKYMETGLATNERQNEKKRRKKNFCSRKHEPYIPVTTIEATHTIVLVIEPIEERTKQKPRITSLFP